MADGSMKLQVRISQRATVTVEGESIKEVFAALAAAQEVFAEANCGLCGTDNIRYVNRQVQKGNKTFDYFECQCQNPACRARLSFGQSQDGSSLFPKRKLLETGEPHENGEYGKHRGWTLWRGGTGGGSGEGNDGAYLRGGNGGGGGNGNSRYSPRDEYR